MNLFRRLAVHFVLLLVVVCLVFGQQWRSYGLFEGGDGDDVGPNLAVYDPVDAADAQVRFGGDFSHRPSVFFLGRNESAGDFLGTCSSYIAGRSVWPGVRVGDSFDGWGAFTHNQGVAHFDNCAIVFLIWNSEGAPAIERTVIPLPHKVPPIHGEDFQSWVDRLAHTHASRLGALCHRIGLRTGPNGTIRNYGVHLTPTQLTRVSTATRIPSDAIAATLLSKFDGTVIDLSTVLTPTRSAGGARRSGTGGQWSTIWASPVASRYCPACLSDDNGAWRLSWRLSTSAVCVRHELLLRNSCPECQLPARAGQDRGTPTYPSLQPQPGFCSNPSQHALNGMASPCGHDLRTAPAVDVSDYPDLVHAQHAVNLASTGSPELFIGTRPAAPADYFAALRDVFAVIAALGLPQDLFGVPSGAQSSFAGWCAARDENWESGKWNPAYRFPPKSAGQTAALLPFAVELLRYPLTESLDSLVARLGERSKWRGLGRRMQFSPAVAEAWEELTSTKVGFSRVADFSTLRPCPVHHEGYGYTAENIPHLIPAFTYDHPFADLLPGTRTNTGRFFTALCLTRVVEGASWTETATALGVDVVRAKTVTDVCAKRVLDPMAWWARIYTLADEYPFSSELPEYGHYRYELRNLTTINPDAWEALCIKHGETTDYGDARRRSAAAYVWAMLTGGDWHYSPAIVHTEAQGDVARSSLLAHYRRFLAGTSSLFLFDVAHHVKDTVPVPNDSGEGLGGAA